ncbi:uncharacterized protein PITG_02367 [Phytophthora infestans T30-4]|uniref:SWIM-type domain-containing protein n=1 Tax=Phytophthora infestans (strain T30-4) TaxID=403677 RepID=D0MW59_PHYIT|nr:uncharacterized protein PITG_02367 [Phytophthora infestans T30-4]EEY63872.1 conserved hypothetical protein [Phytophthora infestans T30-4]|eukprot:XP_002907308.1 conserved hypothetical protein [Phytophthora infestans T30-4]
MDPELNSPSTTLFKDKRFKDSKVALYAVQDYALYYNKRVKVARRGGKHCRGMTDHTWYVSSSDLTHLPECTSTAKPTQRQLVESSSFLKALAATPDGTATRLLRQLQGKTNLRTIYRAKQVMKQKVLNQAGNSVKNGALSRAFLSCSVFTQLTGFNHQIYMFEVTPCNNSEANYQGVQMNYRWFFRCVEDSGVDLKYCPVLCTLDAELIAVASELGLTLRYCTRYIIEHELAQIGSFNKHHHALVWGLQGSEREVEYDNRLEWIGNLRTFCETLEQEQIVISGAGSGAQDLYDAQCRHIGEYKVRRASETVAFTSTCTCTFIGQYAIPCRHLIAVLLFCNQMDSLSYQR